MSYLLSDLIDDIIQMSYVDYSDKKSLRKYNKLASRASRYWLGQIPCWSESKLHEFEAQIEHENLYVSSYIIEVLLREKALPIDKVKQYAKKLENNILVLEKCDAKVTIEIWLSMWKKGMIQLANEYPYP